MVDPFVESHIQRHPLFQGLDAQELDMVIKAFQVLRFQRGELVVQQGNPTQGMFIFASGQGIFTRTQPDGTERRIEVLSTGDVVDGEAIFHTSTERFNLRITEDAVVLFLSLKRMNIVLSYFPGVRAQLERVLQPQAKPPAPVIQKPPVPPPAAVRKPPPMRQQSTPQEPETHKAEKPPHKQQQPTPQPQRPASPSKKWNTKIGDIKREGEEVVMVRRRHPWAFIRRGWWPTLLMVLSVFAAIALWNVGLGVLGFAVIGTGGIFSLLLMGYFYLEWRNDSFVVTDTRVIRIERIIPTFTVHINEIPINRVQEVNTELPERDLFARIFRYGDVELKNASDAGDMVLDMVPQPEDVQEAIFDRQARFKDMAVENKRSVIEAEIAESLGMQQTETNMPEGDNPTDKLEEDNANPMLADEISTKPAKSVGWSPARMRFINEDGDTVYRKHITIWLASLTGPLLVLLGAFVLAVVSFAYIGSGGLLSQFGLLAAVALGIVGGLWFWWSDWDWRNDMYILSDDRVTLIHRRPLWLQNEVEQILLNRVDNVISEMSGLVDTAFQRGDVRLSLVGEGLENAKVFHKVHKPQDIQAEISRRQSRAKLQEEEQRDQRRRQELNEYLSVYHEMVRGKASPPGE